MEKIEAKNIEFEHSGSDSGMTFTLICPKCTDKIRVAECCWWDTECSCGYYWKLDIRAIGEK